MGMCSVTGKCIDRLHWCRLLHLTYRGRSRGGLVGFERTSLFTDLLVLIVISGVLDTQCLPANPVQLQCLIACISITLGLV